MNCQCIRVADHVTAGVAVPDSVSPVTEMLAAGD